MLEQVLLLAAPARGWWKARRGPLAAALSTQARKPAAISLVEVLPGRGGRSGSLIQSSEPADQIQ